MKVKKEKPEAREMAPLWVLAVNHVQPSSDPSTQVTSRVWSHVPVTTALGEGWKRKITGACWV